MGTATAPPVEGDRAAVMPSGDEWLRRLRRLGAATLSGLAAGTLIGGVGGRLAMFVLRLTSDDSLRGIETDDGFIIGSFTTDTIFFVVFTAAAGTLLAVPYLVVRRWLPTGRRPAQAAVFFGLVGGAAVIEPGGVDFTFIDPRPLAVALFIALPAAYGAAMAAGTEWLLGQPDRWRTARYVALAPLALTGVVGAAVVLVAGGAVLAGRRWPALTTVVDGTGVTWAVRVALLVGTGLGLIQLVSDVGEIL